MAEYQLTATDIVIRTEDMASIPNDPANRDRIEYEKWLAAGGIPDPYVPPPEPPIIFTADQRLDNGVAAAITTAQAALTALEDIPTTGALPARFQQMQLNLGIIAAAFVAMLEAHAESTPDE